MDVLNLVTWPSLDFLLLNPITLAFILLVVVQAIKGEFDRIWVFLFKKKPRTKLLTLFLAALWLYGGHALRHTLTWEMGLILLPIYAVLAMYLSGAPFMSKKLKELLQTTTTNQGASQ